MDDLASYVCPHCGESIELGVDPTGGREQVFVQDCSVCCGPNVLTVRFDREGSATVDAVAE